MTMMRKLLATSVLCVAAMAGVARAEVLSLQLGGALPYQEARAKPAKVQNEMLMLDVVIKDGKPLANVWGFTPITPGQEHLGRVTSHTIKEDTIELNIALPINHNRERPCIIGGTAEITLKLTRSGEKLSGTFTVNSKDAVSPEAIRTLEDAWGFGETIGGQDWEKPLIRNRMERHLASGATTGEVNGTVTRNPLLEGTLNLGAGEHPRLLFRKADVEKLRQRAATPEGQKIINEMKALLTLAEEKGFAFHNAAEAGMGNMYAAGYGLLYQLTGDKQYAAKAKAWVTANFYGAYWYGGWHIHSYTLAGTALTYDLCYDAWDQDFRDMIYCYLEQNIRHLAMRHDPHDFLKSNERFVFANDQSTFNIKSVRDGYANKFRASAAMAALALGNDPVPAYKPVPFADVPTIEPQAEEPWVGVPVVKFTSDKMPYDWLINGPFKRGEQDKILEKGGGFAAARPEPGDVLMSDGVAVDWRRYEPSGVAVGHTGSPTIYARVCSRYWASATGGGYNPGITLMRKWATEQTQRGVAHNIAIYTVIHNDRERIVQACPNWRSRTSGCRMWISGREVKDGDLVRLKPGYYPLMVDVPVVGGYSAQSPKLREYTQREYDKDAALYAKAIEANRGDDPATNQMLRNTMVLARSLQRYMAADIGADGWGVSDVQESLLPFVATLRHVTGVDMSKGAPLEKLLPLATRMRGHADARTYDYMVSQGVSFFPAEEQPIARWYLDTYSLGIRRPFDAVMALAQHPIGVTPESPEKRFKRASMFAGYDVHAFRSGWSGGKDVLVTIDGTGAGFNSPHVAGNLMIHGLGRHWVLPRDGERFGHANVFAVKDFIPAGTKTLAAVHNADGSGAVTLQVDDFREVKFSDNGKQWTLGKANRDLAVTRAFGVDYSGKAGAPVLVVIADTIAGAAYREKIWRFDVGNIGFGKTDPERFSTKGNSFVVRFAKPNDRMPEYEGNAQMNVNFIGPGVFEYDTRSYNKEGTMFIVEAKLERETRETEKVGKKGVGELSGTGMHDELMGDIKKKEEIEKRKFAPPITVWTVITVQAGAAPAITHTGDGDKAVLTIGEQTVRLENNKIVFSPK